MHEAALPILDGLTEPIIVLRNPDPHDVRPVHVLSDAQLAQVLPQFAAAGMEIELLRNEGRLRPAAPLLAAETRRKRRVVAASRTIGRRFAPRWRFILLLPVTYTLDGPARPGDDVEASKFLSVEERLVARFGGFTKLTTPGRPVVEGQWRDPATGLLFADRHRRYEIVAERHRAHSTFLLDLTTELLASFRQEEIFLTRDATHVAVTA